jgi:hydrogenase maturation protease
MDRHSVLILGIGNVLWADEGFGVRCAEAMAARHAFPEAVTVLDGGTQGLYLLPHLAEADTLIVFDAVDYGDPPGTLRVVRDEAVPAFMGAKRMSLHQTGFQDVLAAAELVGSRPEHLVLLGVQPAVLEDYGGGLTRSVAAQVDAAIAIALAELDRLGIAARPAACAAHINDPAIARDAYEEGRPDPRTAFRHGDARFINLRASGSCA